MPRSTERCKATIDEGFALSFGDGMQLEKQRSREYNAQVGAAAIEARREGVRARNRS